MKVVLLSGGFGTRLSEYTETIPKPMVTVGGRPMLWHIMSIFSHFGYKDFVIALGYKGEVIKEYFLNYISMNSNLSVDLKSGEVTPLKKNEIDWQVTLADTGLETLTGGRLKRTKQYVSDGPFMMTYGDAVSNIDINALVEFHNSHGKLVTVTAVHPAARFGELKIKDDRVVEFQEKPQTGEGWINGGFFVIEPEFLDFIEEDHTILEREPLEKAASLGELMAFKHEGFWHCMDVKRDRESLEKLWQSGGRPWVR